MEHPESHPLLPWTTGYSGSPTSRTGIPSRGTWQGIEYYSSESTAQAFAVGITAIAAFQGYRYLKTQDWAPGWLKAVPDEVAVLPLRSGGAMLTYESRF